MFRNNLLRKNIVGESGALSLLQKEKRSSAKFDVSKVLFPDIGKITNLDHEGTYTKGHGEFPSAYIFNSGRFSRGTEEELKQPEKFQGKSIDRLVATQFEGISSFSSWIFFL